jgi:hypothetical protein
MADESYLSNPTKGRLAPFAEGATKQQAEPTAEPSPRLPRSQKQPSPEKPSFAPLAEGGPLRSTETRWVLPDVPA